MMSPNGKPAPPEKPLSQSPGAEAWACGRQGYHSCCQRLKHSVSTASVPWTRVMPGPPALPPVCSLPEVCCCTVAVTTLRLSACDLCSAQKDSVLSLMPCCLHLAVLHDFWTGGSALSFCTKPTNYVGSPVQSPPRPQGTGSLPSDLNLKEVTGEFEETLGRQESYFQICVCKVKADLWTSGSWRMNSNISLDDVNLTGYHQFS